MTVPFVFSGSVGHACSFVPDDTVFDRLPRHPLRPCVRALFCARVSGLCFCRFCHTGRAEFRIGWAHVYLIFRLMSPPLFITSSFSVSSCISPLGSVAGRWTAIMFGRAAEAPGRYIGPLVFGRGYPVFRKVSPVLSLDPVHNNTSNTDGCCLTRRGGLRVPSARFVTTRPGTPRGCCLTRSRRRRANAR